MAHDESDEYHLVKRWSLEKAAETYVLFSRRTLYRSLVGEGDEAWAQRNAERLGIEIEVSDETAPTADTWESRRGR